MKAKPYPKYKPSGIEWLGDVPEHWEVAALKRSFRIVNGGTPSSTESHFWDGEIEWYTPEDLGKNYSKCILDSRRKLTIEGLSNCGASITPSGSVLISTRAPIGHVAVTTDVASCNQGCRFLVSRGNRASADFAYYTALASKEVLQSAGKGTTFLELSAGALGAHCIPLPSSAEQRAIADFLDRETARIDALVAKKRELIERLKEKRSALISQTVTRGLPPEAAAKAGLPVNPRLKPSGVDWLGDVPEHWEVKKGRYVGALIGSESPTEDQLVDDETVEAGDLPYAKVDDLNSVNGSLKLISTKVRARGCRARKGPVLLFPKRGAAIFTNKVAISDVPVLFDPNLMGWKIYTKFAVKFVAYCLIARRLDDLADVSTVPQINNKHIYPAAFPLPPINEQNAIISYLEIETSKLDTLVAKVEDMIERLQERRTALITAAVTGKIDVSRHAP